MFRFALSVISVEINHCHKHMHHWFISLIVIKAASAFGPVKYFESSEMTKEIFDSLLLNGEVAVIRNASSFWPLASWTCDQFRTRQEMRGFRVERVYGANDGSFVPLCSACDEWEKDERPSFNDDPDGPTLAPIYWDVKGNEASLKVIDSLTPAWPFLSTPNHYWKKNAVELWFTPPKAGAKYHIDGHVQMTAVSQLVGTRRWRLAKIPNEATVGLIPNHLDVDSFKWTPDVSVTLETGDLLLFPPGTIHDTLNLDDSACAVSVTHQLGVPYPAKFFRTHLRQFLRVGDTRETWPVISDLASFGFLRARLATEPPFFETHESIATLFPINFQYNETNPVEFFSHVYQHFIDRPDGLVGHFGKRRINEYVAYHDKNGDGSIGHSEFIEGAIEWLYAEVGILTSLPEKFRPLRYFYSQIEGLVSPAYMDELRSTIIPPIRDEL